MYKVYYVLYTFVNISILQTQFSFFFLLPVFFGRWKEWRKYIYRVKRRYRVYWHCYTNDIDTETVNFFHVGSSTGIGWDSQSKRIRENERTSEGFYIWKVFIKNPLSALICFCLSRNSSCFTRSHIYMLQNTVINIDRMSKRVEDFLSKTKFIQIKQSASKFKQKEFIQFSFNEYYIYTILVAGIFCVILGILLGVFWGGSLRTQIFDRNLKIRNDFTKNINFYTNFNLVPILNFNGENDNSFLLLYWGQTQWKG